MSAMVLIKVELQDQVIFKTLMKKKSQLELF